MNKKLATFLFAIGLGVTAGPALASCMYYCSANYNNCMHLGKPAEQCEAAREACEDACGCQEECCNPGSCRPMYDD